LWRNSQLLSEFAQRMIGRSKFCAAPIAGDQMDESIGLFVVGDAKIGDLSTEVVRMCAASIEAVIGGRDNGCQHLTLPAAERRRTVHERTVKIHRRFERAGVLAHDRNDAPDATSAFECSLILHFEQTGGFVE
jgi:hypothetical protein